VDTPEEELLIGRFVGVHGIRGSLKVYSYAESTDIFRPGVKITVRRSETERHSYTIESVSPYKRGVRFGLKGISNRTDAEPLIGADFYIHPSILPEPEEGAFYWSDLMGIEVYTADEQFLGKMTSIIETGSNDVYVVEGSLREILIPALESVVLSVDIESGRMTVDLPEGLVE